MEPWRLVFGALEALGTFLEASRGLQDEVFGAHRLVFSMLLIEIALFLISTPLCSRSATSGGLEGAGPAEIALGSSDFDRQSCRNRSRDRSGRAPKRGF